MKTIRHSKQRDLVLETVRCNLIHPTARDVYEIVRKKAPDISLGTVYRNLNMLADMGQILRIEVPGEADRFDGRYESHSHAVCSRCGCVMDYSFDFEDLNRHLMDETGFECQDICITVRGLCKNCRNGNK